MATTNTTTQSPKYGGKLPSVRDGLAIASLVCAFFAPILGIIFGHMSNHKAKKAGREKSGLAIAGLILGYIFTGIAALIMVIALAVRVSATSTATASPALPASSAPAHLSKPSTPPANPAPAKPRTLLQAGGSGNYTTAKFTVGGSGDYDVYWTYKPSADFASQGLSANFSVQADNGNDIQFNNPNQLGNGGSGVVHVYGDAGTHYLTITGEADWAITVTAMSGQPAAPQASGAQPAQPVPGTSAKAVVDQFYQDLNDHNYQAAWQLGGSNLSGGSGYSTWVAGYATTASISASTMQSNDGTVSASVTAMQANGSVKTYAGTYTVANGAIVAAHITQTGGPN
jgi:Domain of unknown function (DUF4190)